MKEINRIDITEMSQEERKKSINEAFGEEVYDLLAAQDGDINRTTAVVNYEADETGLARAVLIGDCECGGTTCRSGWGWIWKARDLDMTGHRGSLKAVPCDGAKKALIVETGKMMVLAPFAMNPDQFYRFQRAEWGDVSRQDAKELAAFSMATTEGQKNAWTPDKKGDA